MTEIEGLGTVAKFGGEKIVQKKRRILQKNGNNTGRIWKY